MRSIASWSLCPCIFIPTLSVSLFHSLSISQVHSSNLRDSLIKILRDEKKKEFGYLLDELAADAWNWRYNIDQKVYRFIFLLLMLCCVYKYIKLSFLSIECLISSFYSWRFSVLRDKNFIKVQFFGQKRSKEFKICMNIFFAGKNSSLAS